MTRSVPAYVGGGTGTIGGADEQDAELPGGSHGPYLITERATSPRAPRLRACDGMASEDRGSRLRATAASAAV